MRKAAALYIRGGAALAAVGCLAMVAGCGGKEPPRPNVLVVVISGVRADHASGYGYRRATTPALDALAAEGTLFENAITPAAWGPAGQASIATGLYVAEHRLSFTHPAIEDRMETLAERLKATGYATFGVTTDAETGRAAGFGQGFDAFEEIHPEQDASPDDGAAAAETSLTRWILQTWKPAEEKGPFFSWAVLTNPRLPFNPPGEYRDRFMETPIPLPKLEQLTQFWLPFARQFTLGLATLSQDEMSALTSLYDAEVSYADYRLGRITQVLKQAGLLDRTLVVVTSDAGEDLGDHGLLSDPSRVYDSIARVPLVMRLPGKVPAGQRISGQVQTLDLGKAILALTETPASKTSPAEDLPLMPPRQAAVIEARSDPSAIRYYRSLEPGADLSGYDMDMVAVRTEGHKYIQTSRNTGALFDLKADPGERKSILADQTAVASDLQAKLAGWAALLSLPRPGEQPAAAKGGAPPGAPASTTPGSPTPPAPAR